MRYPARVFRPWLRVARPDDWTGKVAWLATTAVLLMLLIAALLARLPASWLDLVGGHAAIVRVVLVLVVFYLIGWLRAIVYSRLPAAAYLFGRWLVVRVRGKAVRVPVVMILEIHVELRPLPAGETFVVELKDGTLYDMCPTHWQGAARLYAALARKLR
jgi:hypothetical protein